MSFIEIFYKGLIYYHEPIAKLTGAGILRPAGVTEEG
jgi:hypothetical protein